MIENRVPDSPAPTRVSKCSTERSSSATEETLATRRGGLLNVLCPAAKTGNKGPLENAKESTGPVIPSPARNPSSSLFKEINAGPGRGITAWILSGSERLRVLCIEALTVQRTTRNRQTPKENMTRGGECHNVIWKRQFYRPEQSPFGLKSPSHLSTFDDTLDPGWTRNHSPRPAFRHKWHKSSRRALGKCH
jgi:hypothetical protein